jgi:ABC-type nitrate/sulfonate/bicarbonate transport system substrate-binding protein
LDERQNEDGARRDWSRLDREEEQTTMSGGIAAPEKNRVMLGIMALNDCAPVVVAREKGFFADEGLEVAVVRESSWANIRDKVAIGEFDAAQMLAPMPIAATLGIDGLRSEMETAFCMGLNGNAITVSNVLAEQIQTADMDAGSSARAAVEGLRRVIDERRTRGHRKLVFSHVFPFSSHNYELRYWLAAAGIDPDADVKLIVIPPSQMVKNLQDGHIDGFCVGEPWNSKAVAASIGSVICTSYDIWSNRAEKVLGVTQEWSRQHPGTHRALVRALIRAAQWLDGSGNRDEASHLLSLPSYLNMPQELIAMSLTGRFRHHGGEASRFHPHFHVFFRYLANYPWASHAKWFISQMYRWRQIQSPIDVDDIAARVFRSDLFAEAAADLGIVCPESGDKVEGVHEAEWPFELPDHSVVTMGRDLFMDGARFDPGDSVHYATRPPADDRPGRQGVES